MTRVEFTVLGVPAPQGSKRHVGHGVMVESSKALPAWRDAVAWAARDAACGAVRTLPGVHPPTPLPAVLEARGVPWEMSAGAAVVGAVVALIVRRWL